MDLANQFGRDDPLRLRVVTPAMMRTYLALLRVYARDGRAGVLAVARELGRPEQPTGRSLARLGQRGLIEWDRTIQMGLRPLYWPVENFTTPPTPEGPPNDHLD